MGAPILNTGSAGASTFARAKTGLDGRPAWVILVAVLVLTLFYYWARLDTIGVSNPGRDWFPMTGGTLNPALHNLVSAALLGLVPLIWARLGTSLTWTQLGLGSGRPRQGLVWLGIGLPLALLAGRISSADPAIRAVYPLNPELTPELGRFAVHALVQLGYYAAWEVLFRGVLLGALQPRFGFANANLIQTGLSVVAHFGRPFPETFAAIPAGLAFGGVARTTGSIWYVIIIHWVVGLAQDWFIITG